MTSCVYYMQEDEDSVLTKNKGLRGDREQEIDVVTVQPIPAFCSRYTYTHTVTFPSTPMNILL